MLTVVFLDTHIAKIEEVFKDFQGIKRVNQKRAALGRLIERVAEIDNVLPFSIDLENYLGNKQSVPRFADAISFWKKLPDELPANCEVTMPDTKLQGCREILHAMRNPPMGSNEGRPDILGALLSYYINYTSTLDAVKSDFTELVYEPQPMREYDDDWLILFEKEETFDADLSENENSPSLHS